MIYVIDVMRQPKVCKVDLKIPEASNIMRKERIGSLIVVNEKQEITGLVTERDIVYRVLAEGKNPAETTVGEVMTENVSTIRPYATVFDAISLMRKKQIRKLPVTKEGKLVGILTEREIITYILKAKEEADRLSIFKELFI